LRIQRDDDGAPRRRSAPTWLLLLGVVVLIGGVIVIWKLQHSAPKVAIGTVVEERPSAGAAPLLTATGYVTARQKASISARRPGRRAGEPLDGALGRRRGGCSPRLRHGPS